MCTYLFASRQCTSQEKQYPDLTHSRPEILNSLQATNKSLSFPQCRPVHVQ